MGRRPKKPKPRELQSIYRSSEIHYTPYLSEVSPATLERYGLSYEQLEELPESDMLIDYFSFMKTKAPDGGESYWNKLVSEWAEKFPDVLLPHIIAEIPNYPLHFGRTECLVETYPEDCLEPPKCSILAELYLIAERIENEEISLFSRSKCEPKTLLSRYELDELIALAGDKFLTQMGLDGRKFRITPISHELYLTLAKRYGWGNANVATLTNKTLDSKVFLAGGSKPSETTVACHYPAGVKHRSRGLCPGVVHTPGLSRLTIVANL